MASRASFLDRIRNVDSLPSPPNVAVQIVQLCQDASSSMQELTRVLSLDAALAARVLRVSNSAAYSRGREVTSLQQAIMTLGARTISIIALGFSLKGAMPSWRHQSGVSDELFWRHSVATGVTARALARLSRYRDHEGAFLCGLMSRVGQLLLYAIAQDEYGEVLTLAAGRLPTPELELETLGISHHEAGSLLLAKWALPTLICDVVQHWNDPPNSNDTAQPEDAVKLRAIVAVSDTLAQLIFDHDKAAGLQRIHIAAQERLGLSGGEVDRMFVACSQDINETLQIFDVALNESLDCEKILEVARQQVVNLSLGLVADLTADLTQERSHTTNLLEENRHLTKASSLDALTGLANRAVLDRELENLQQARTSQGAVAYSIMMIDVDHFKQVNDTYGHAVGDEVLRSVAECLMTCARATDLVARYGGEEFAVILTNAGKAEAAQVAERFRSAIESRTIELQDRVLSVTASLGVACSDSPPGRPSATEVIQQADAALYAAKRQGRNRVVTYAPDTVPTGRH